MSAADLRWDRRAGGFFITLEGAEGCGKSTQARLLAERIRGLGRVTRELREPGGVPLAEEIRGLLKHHPAGQGMTPEAELLLMNAARAQLVREAIRPALSRGEVVVCDRFLDSTIAYQGWGRGLDLQWVERIVEFALDGVRPDLTILLDVAESEAARRVAARAGTPAAEPPDRFESAGRDFFARVNQGYRAQAAANPERIQIVDASGDVGSVHAAIWSVTEARLRVAEGRSPFTLEA
jgi:dTMP kinase